VKKFVYKTVFLGFAPSFLLCIVLKCQAFPPAYGLCIICHARDAINFLINFIFPTYYLTYGFFLTPLSVVLGSALSTKNKEWKRQKSSIEYFFYGFFSAIGALIIGMCPVRITSLLAWFNLPALIAFVGFVIGVCLCLKNKN